MYANPSFEHTNAPGSSQHTWTPFHHPHLNTIKMLEKHLCKVSIFSGSSYASPPTKDVIGCQKYFFGKLGHIFKLDWTF